MKHTIVVAAAAALFSFAAQAQTRAPAPTPWFGEVGYTVLDARDDFGFKANPTAIRGIIGYNFHPNFAAEAMLLGGVSSDSDQGVDVKIQHSIGVFAQPKVSFGDFEVFGRLGWARTRVRASALGVSASETDDSFAWGAGANYNFASNMYVSLDYTRYYDKSSTRIDGVTLGFGYRF